ncbi:MAG: dockerin type I domain-containing protein [Gemmataceae bacterium]
MAGVLPPPAEPNQCAAEPVLDRQYITDEQTGGAVSWWNSQTGPRMLSVTYNSIHTPYQQPPDTPLLSGPPFVCVGNTQADIASQRLVATAMLGAMDQNIGQLLAGLGLAQLDSNGTIITVKKRNGMHIPQLDHSNTLVAVIGDNGTYGVIVKPPFDPFNSKATVYQTGVWVPAIVAGSMIKGPRGRSEDAMVNAVDFFDLFSEAAGVDPNTLVPPAHILDAKPMLPYLTKPSAPPQRDTNFTELGLPVFQEPTNDATRSWPCAIGGTVGSSGDTATLTGGSCSDTIFTTQSFCEQENNGVWLGPQNEDQPPLQFPNPNSSDGSWSSCCDVQIGLDPTLRLIPLNQWAMRDSGYKFIEQQFAECSQPLCPGPQCTTVFPPFARTNTYEFYNLAQTADNPAGLDCPYDTSNSNNPGTCTSPNDIACSPDSSDPPESCVPNSLKPEYEKLQTDLNNMLASEPACPGDGNLDKFVNQFDIDGVNDFNGVSSFFDFNHDATTNYQDLLIVQASLGKDCIGICTRADLNRDGRVNRKDLRLLKRQLGRSCSLCGADLNGDGAVNQRDVNIMKQAMTSCH